MGSKWEQGIAELFNLIEQKKHFIATCDSLKVSQRFIHKKYLSSLGCCTKRIEFSAGVSAVLEDSQSVASATLEGAGTTLYSPKRSTVDACGAPRRPLPYKTGARG